MKSSKADSAKHILPDELTSTSFAELSSLLYPGSVQETKPNNIETRKIKKWEIIASMLVVQTYFYCLFNMTGKLKCHESSAL